MQIETKELATVKAQVSRAQSAANALEIATKEDLEKATDILSKIKSVGKLMKEKKEAITKPINQALKEVRDLFRPIEEAYDAAETMIKTKMIGYQEKAEAERREQEAKIAARVEKGTMKFETGAKKIEALEKVEGKVEGLTGAITFRVRRDVEITNENQIPDKYWVIDMVMLRKDTILGRIEVPGTKIVEHKEVAAK